MHGVAAFQALGKGLNDLPVLADLPDRDALGGAAVVLPDDDLLGHVHQTAGQVARVRRPQGGIRQALPGASGGDKVLQHRQAFPEVGLDGDLNGPAGGIRHQAAHAGQLTDLRHGATGAGVRHHKDGVVPVQSRLQGLGHILGGLLPSLDHQAVPLVVGEEAPLKLAFNLHNLLLRLADQGVLLLGNGHIVNGDRQRAQGGVVVPAGLDDIQHFRRLGKAMAEDTLVNDFAQLLFAADEVDLRLKAAVGVISVHKAQVLGNALVENQAAHGGADQLVARFPVHRGGHPHQDGHVKLQLSLVIGQTGFLRAGKGVEHFLGELTRAGDPAGLIGRGGQEPFRGLHPNVVALTQGSRLQRGGGILRTGIDIGGVGGGILLIGEVVGAQHHVLGGDRNRSAVLGPQQVVGRKHQDTRLRLGLGGQRHVYCHLVPVKVGVKRSTHQGVQLDGPAFHQHRLKGLDSQAVKGGGTVEHDRMLLDDEVQRVPDLGAAPVHHLFGGLDVVGQAILHQLLHDKGAEELNGHLLGQAALVNFQFRTHHDNGTAGVVHPLAQQVLPEPALLALEHVGQGLQGPVVGAGDRTAPAAVVDEGIHGLLQHPLLVAYNDVRRVELDQPLEPVVPVDYPAVQVV